LRPPLLAPAEVARRARQIKLVLTDSDGVLTDTGVYYSERGEELKRFSIRDGMGVQRLRQAGVETGIVTGEMSPSVVRRGEKLGLRHVLLGVKDKLSTVRALCAEHGLTLGQLAFIGDDVNDLAVLTEIGRHGLTAAPADALPPILGTVHHVSAVPGGHGAFRDFAEWILDHREIATPSRRSRST
jgi:3-deoxy-D-manno-octulosonate 8-phosphate phosphatase (KDO 8-P phosphatase)